MVPEWAPNVHPIIVHFPIALLFIAVLVDFLAIMRHRFEWLQLAATGLYVLGAITAWMAFFSGREAAEEVLLPAAANPVLTEHADWAQWTASLYGVLALVRLVAIWQGWMLRKVVHLFFFLIAAGGLFMLYETGDHGAQLVYKYGIGVSAIDRNQRDAHDRARHQGDREIANNYAVPADSGIQEVAGREENKDQGHEGHEAEIALHVEENGSWIWDIGRDSKGILAQHFEWLTGDSESLNPMVVRDAERGDVLALHPKETSSLGVAGKPLVSVQGDLELNTNDFSGKIMIVHHVQDSRNFNFLSIEGDEMSLGEVRDGETKIHDKDNISTEGWLAVRVVSDKTHFRGYVDGKMKVHGHGKEPSPGRVGLFVEGTGTLLLDYLSVTSLR
jgi:uncharacterized membrane protein